MALALLGLAVAAAVSLAASRLSSQHIGLSAEPLTAGPGAHPGAERHADGGPAADHHPSQVEPDPNEDGDHHDESAPGARLSAARGVARSREDNHLHPVPANDLARWERRRPRTSSRRQR